MSDQTMQEIIQDQLDVLPEEVKEMVESKEWRKKVYDLGRKYELKIDQLGSLEQEVFYTMIGLVPSSEFVSDLVNRIGVSREHASSLAHEIDAQVFEGIRHFIMQMDDLDDEDDYVASEGAAPAAASAEFKGETVPSRDDLLREIEEIGGGAPMAVPTSYSPIDTQLSRPVVSKPVNLGMEMSKTATYTGTAAPTAVRPTPAATPVAVTTNPAPVAPIAPAKEKTVEEVVPEGLQDVMDLDTEDIPKGGDAAATMAALAQEFSRPTPTVVEKSLPEPAPITAPAPLPPYTPVSTPIPTAEPTPAAIPTAVATPRPIDPMPVNPIPVDPSTPIAPIAPATPAAVPVAPIPSPEDPYREAV